MKTTDYKASCRSEQGLLMLMAAVILVVLGGLAALVIDLGLALYEQRRIEIAADMAALAGVAELGAADPVVGARIFAIAGLNDLQPAEILSWQCGQWADLNFIPCHPVKDGNSDCSDCEDAQANAVRVVARREVAAHFARLVGITQLTPRVEVIAHRRRDAAQVCVKPFGVEDDFLLNSQPPVAPGSQITVGPNSPGNWGKIDIHGINMSSATNFYDYMQTGVCEPPVSQGDTFPGATGFSQVREAMQPFKDGAEMVFLVVSPFGSGKKDITIQRFVHVQLLNQGRSGANWWATFLVIEIADEVPSVSDTTTGLPVLVK